MARGEIGIASIDLKRPELVLSQVRNLNSRGYKFCIFNQILTQMNVWGG